MTKQNKAMRLSRQKDLQGLARNINGTNSKHPDSGVATGGKINDEQFIIFLETKSMSDVMIYSINSKILNS